MKQEEIDTGAVRREVRTCEHDGRPARALVIERTYDAPVDDVWDAVTTPERIARWLAPVEGDLQLGGRYQLEGNASGEVTACDKPTHLALTWELGGVASWVDVRIEAGPDPDGGTVLRLEHVALLDDIAMFDQFGPGAIGIGWDLTLYGLARYLDTGEKVDADAEAASGGPAAQLMVRSNEGWCEADIASGTPEDKARAGAAATIAMYTGGGGEGEGEGED
jgi:uncharacterized protein YndB with AHSA1/START domain